MTEYLIRVRVRTQRHPRDDPMPYLERAAQALFKTRPGGDLHIIGATVEQVPSIMKDRP